MPGPANAQQQPGIAVGEPPPGQEKPATADVQTIPLTLSSVALLGVANPAEQRDKSAYERYRANLARNTEVAKATGAITNAIKSIPGVGTVFQVLDGLTDLVGMGISSTGGYNDLPLLARKRIVLYGVLSEVPGSPSYVELFPSQNFDPSQPTNLLGRRLEASVPGSLSTGTKPGWQDWSEDQFVAWLVAWMIRTARRQEFARIAKTPDDGSLPIGLIAALYEAGIWPPPIEPFPVTQAAWEAIYPMYRQWYTYPAVIPPEKAALAAEIYREAVNGYARDARRYTELVGGRFTLAPSVAEVVERNGMLPRYGSVLNPRLISGRPSY